MLDIRFIRENPEAVKENAKNKGYEVDVDSILSLDEKRRNLIVKSENLREKRNELSKSKDHTPESISEAKNIREELGGLENELSKIEQELSQELRKVPNMALREVPVGKSEEENVVVNTVGKKTEFDFKPKSDEELGELHGIIDKERASKIAGARFAYLKGGLVKLQFAIIQMVIDVLTDEELIKKIIDKQKLNLKPTPFVPILPPYLIRTEPYLASGRLDSEEVTYKLADDELWLNASAEHSLCTMFMNEKIDESQLPIRMLGYSTSFRREAGSYGKDTEGIFRMHQFDKLEMEIFSSPETGLEEHKLLVALQEYLVQQLDLPYQVVQKCTADIGKPNAQGIDIDTWMPAQQKYRETHTADYMTDYQTRSLNIKIKTKEGNTEYAHTNDATAFALGRIMKAILENHQTHDGKIKLPKAIAKYYGADEL
jgi:seryl-tRNA synthetase